MIKTPAFWTKKSLLSTALLPFSALYLSGHRSRQKNVEPYKANLPVICVGNAVAGGSGKTPTAIALIEILKNIGLCHKPIILTRGYGGTLPGPVLVDTNAHNFEQVGDEALLLSKSAPVIKSADRKEGAIMAEEMGMDMIIMDDGLQNPGLYKDLSILVIDGAFGFGNERLLPAGPLRAPLDETLRKTDIVIAIGQISSEFTSKLNGKPVYHAALKPQISLDPHQPYIGFAGIGRPDKFKQSLEAAGAKLLEFHAFADHHPYGIGDIKKLKNDAQNKRAKLITTEKDYIRLPTDFKAAVDCFPVALAIENPEALQQFLHRTLEGF